MQVLRCCTEGSPKGDVALLSAFAASLGRQLEQICLGNAIQNCIVLLDYFAPRPARHWNM